jgi:hypothetical protein
LKNYAFSALHEVCTINEEEVLKAIDGAFQIDVFQEKKKENDKNT